MMVGNVVWRVSAVQILGAKFCAMLMRGRVYESMRAARYPMRRWIVRQVAQRTGRKVQGKYAPSGIFSQNGPTFPPIT